VGDLVSPIHYFFFAAMSLILASLEMGWGKPSRVRAFIWAAGAAIWTVALIGSVTS
jgi:hypothetical protein